MTLKISTFNANSVRARLPIIQDWLKREKPHVLCLQETKVQDKDFPQDEFENSGYRVIFRGQKSYNGVAIITSFSPSEIRKDLHNEGDEDARFLSAKLGDIQVINVYVPQGYEVGSEKFAYKLKWMDELLSYVRATYKPSDRLVITGDFNVALEDIDVWDPDKFRGEVCFHPDERKIVRNLLEWGMEDIFRKHEQSGAHYTFWDYRIPNALKRKMGWRIDYILATPPVAKKVKAVNIDKEARLLPKPSDHTFLSAVFDINP